MDVLRIPVRADGVPSGDGWRSRTRENCPLGTPWVVETRTKQVQILCALVSTIPSATSTQSSVPQFVFSLRLRSGWRRPVRTWPAGGTVVGSWGGVGGASDRQVSAPQPLSTGSESEGGSHGDCWGGTRASRGDRRARLLPLVSRSTAPRCHTGGTHKEHFSIQWNLSNTDTFGPTKCVLIREASSFQGGILYEVGTWSSVLIREMSLIQGCPLTLYTL